MDALLGGLRSEKPRLTRLQAWGYACYRDALRTGFAPCTGCGRMTPLRFGFPPDGPPSLRDVPGLHVRCDACGSVAAQGLHALTLSAPEGQRFWRAHPRPRLLPDREVEADGLPARVVTIESVANGARYSVVAARETRVLLRINGEPGRSFPPGSRSSRRSDIARSASSSPGR
jgi:hypothetical protein